MSKIYYSDTEFEELLITLSSLTERIDQMNDPLEKEMVYEALKHFDAIHREALHRMWQYIRKNNPEIRKRMLSDYTIKHLLALYDLEAFEGIEKAKDNKVFISEDQVTKL